MKRYFGCHVSAAGGLANAIRNGAALGVNTIQIHPTPPQRWMYKPFQPAAAAEFLEAKAGSCVEKVFFHGVYLINLATADHTMLGHGMRSLQYYLDLMEAIGGDGVIFHVGSNKDQESEEAGFRQAADSINRVLESAKGRSKLLLEVAAGSGKIIGDKMEELRAIYEMIDDKARVGFALDSQHMWASGYDLAGRLSDVVRQIEKVLTVEKLGAIHLNDSKTELASRADRHENLGDGTIGKTALAGFIKHPKLTSVPVILETPGMKDLASAAKEVAKLRSMIAG